MRGQGTNLRILTTPGEGAPSLFSEWLSSHDLPAATPWLVGSTANALQLTKALSLIFLDFLNIRGSSLPLPLGPSLLPH